MLVSQTPVTINSDQKGSSMHDLELFRMLLQPHFLFNSLNNLYSLSVQQSEKTSDAIAGLSELLEKVVEYSRMEVIPLQKEVELIWDFIELEKIWLGETRFCMDFHIHGSPEDVAVPPLVLYTFVENCFKHGVRKCPGNGWVTLHLECREGKLWFITRNAVPDTCDNPAETGHRSGLGLDAALQVLESRYPGSYKLITRQKGSVYAVDLRIDLPVSRDG